MEDNNFSVGDIVYRGWKWRSNIEIYKCKIVKINPKTYSVIDLRIKWGNLTPRSQSAKYIFKTEEECYNFYNQK